MKKILILLCFVFLCLAGFSQTGNDTLKYTYYRYTYGEKFNRIWGLNVVDLPNDTTYSKYGIARKHDSVYVGNGILWKLVSTVGGGNIYNTSARLTGARIVSGALLNTIAFDSMQVFGAAARLINLNVWNGAGGITMDSSSIRALLGGNNFNYLTISGDSILLKSWNLGTDSTRITLNPTAIRINGVKQANDTTAYKPVAMGTDGILKRMDGWPGGGGGGATSRQAATAAGGVTTFTFTSVPASFNDYMMFVNGILIIPTTDYTTSGNVVTIPGIINGDKVVFWRIK